MQTDLEVRRHPDGSIDFEFYRRRAAKRRQRRRQRLFRSFFARTLAGARSGWLALGRMLGAVLADLYRRHRAGLAAARTAEQRLLALP